MSIVAGKCAEAVAGGTAAHEQRPAAPVAESEDHAMTPTHTTSVEAAPSRTGVVVQPHLRQGDKKAVPKAVWTSANVTLIC